MKSCRSTTSIVLLALSCATSVSAEVYRSVDEHGNVTFTNQATEGAEPVKLRPLSVYEAPVLKAQAKSRTADTDKAKGYESIEIISPQADETLRDNPGNVTVTVSSKPALDRKAGHHFQFFLDGRAVDKPRTAATMMFTNIDRGEHRVEVAIIDARGNELARSKAIRFFLHRQTIFNPARSGGIN